MPVEPLRNFRRIRAGIDTQPFIWEIEALEHLWTQNLRRQTYVSSQRETNTIFLREADRRREPEEERCDNQSVVATRHAASFPRTMAFLDEIAALQRSELQRVLLVRLPPAGRVYPHVDRGSYYALRDRYHLVVRSAGGSWLRSGDEVVTMREGELWWFDNKLRHEAKNAGEGWRIHLIFDLLPTA